MHQSVFTLVLMAALGVFGGAEARAQSNAPGSWTVEECATCHDKAVTTSFAKTPHAQLRESCASCHSGVAEHVKAEMSGVTTGPTPTLKNLSANDLNTRCLSCHEKGRQQNFLSSMHSRRNVACTSCHSVHAAQSVKAQLKTKNDSDTCFTCHKSERAKSLRMSHHPVREGKMGCASCHNPHDGSRPKMLVADSINEVCYSCHTEKRGPFLFEHGAVREECTSCHEPHGSNHERLLVAKQPYLCQRCHQSGHGANLYPDLSNTEGGGLPTAPVAPSTSVAQTTISSRAVERSCKQCHYAIHGSNSASGQFFVR